MKKIQSIVIVLTCLVGPAFGQTNVTETPTNVAAAQTNASAVQTNTPAAQTNAVTAQTNAPAAQQPPPKAEEPAHWSFGVYAYTYFLEDGRSYIQPTLTV